MEPHWLAREARADEPGSMLSPDACLAVLARSVVFRSVPLADLRALVGRGAFRAVKAGAHVFLQGQSDASFCVVLTGRVRIVAASPDGRLLFHRLISSGGVFGELAVLDGGERTAGAVAQRDSEILSIEREVFLRFLEDHSRVAIQLAMLMAQRIRSTSDHLQDSVFLDAPQRIAKKLIELARERGKQATPGVWQLEGVTHEELGNTVGVHRVSVSNHLRPLEELGLIRRERSRIVILDLEGLVELCSPR
jgi:CRP/FNR family transcriptional regulator, cyclic AMP receptor protein